MKLSDYQARYDAAPDVRDVPVGYVGDVRGQDDTLLRVNPDARPSWQPKVEVVAFVEVAR